MNACNVIITLLVTSRSAARWSVRSCEMRSTMSFFALVFFLGGGATELGAPAPAPVDVEGTG